MTLTSCSVATSVAGTPLLETGRFVYKITYETFCGIGWVCDRIVSLDAIEASYNLDDFVSGVEERWMRIMGASNISPSRLLLIFTDTATLCLLVSPNNNLHITDHSHIPYIRRHLAPLAPPHLPITDSPKLHVPTHQPTCLIKEPSPSTFSYIAPLMGHHLPSSPSLISHPFRPSFHLFHPSTSHHSNLNPRNQRKTPATVPILPNQPMTVLPPTQETGWRLPNFRSSGISLLD